MKFGLLLVVVFDRGECHKFGLRKLRRRHTVINTHQLIRVVRNTNSVIVTTQDRWPFLGSQ